jgi:mannose-1-phosphate guanylyltransferase
VRSIADDLWALVLAGGDGTRLQALTRQLAGAPIPKQYCRITGDRSMLEATLARVAGLVPTAHIVAIVNRDHLRFAEGQLDAIPAPNVLVQPRNRDTGPGLLFSLLELERRDPRAMVAVFPSDHYIREDRTFLAHVARAFHLVRQLPEKIVLLGMTPDRIDPGLGYVEPGRPLAGPAGAGTFHVAAFVEKPEAETAEQIVRRGGMWNSFVMVFRLDRMLSLLRRRRLADYAALQRADHDAYASLAPWNFSRDFLAHVPEALVVLRVCDVGWSDWGTPESIERTLLALNMSLPWRSDGLPTRWARAS